MFKKLTLGMLFVFALSLAAFGVQAQDAITLDEPVQGELTEDAFAVEYTYKGAADDVLVITLAPVDVFGELNNPALIVRGPSGDELLRYDGFGTSTIVTLLPEDGTYTIVATRTDDAEGTSVGEYTLSVIQPGEIALGDTSEMSITSEQTVYYVYRGEDPFTLSYVRTEGVGGEDVFAPEFTINTIDTEISPGTLDTVATVGGPLASQGMVGVIPGGDVYIIKVGQALFDFYFDTLETTYTITIEAAE